MLFIPTLSMSTMGLQKKEIDSSTNLFVKEIIYHEDYGSGIWRMREDGSG